MSTKWLDEFLETISGCWEWHSPAMQVGFRYIEPEPGDDCWEIWAYPAVQEIVGGKEDGETVWTGFNFDILAFLNEIEPEAAGLTTRIGGNPSEIMFEGRFCGKAFFLHVCLEPLEDVEATEILDIGGASGPVIREKE